jgi:3-hydroxyacyl-[acyl-carrier-protein] dehydratase
VNRDEIEQRIPHRDPFLWLDEIVEIGEKRIHARKYLDPMLDVFTGHYPHFPVLPGVIQCEMVMQAGAVFVSETGTLPDGVVPVATRMNNVKFKRLVRPGETVDIEAELTDRVANAYFLSGKVSVAGELATRLDFAFAVAKPNA